MKRIATLAALALVIGVGGALRVMACEDGSFAMDEPVVIVPQQVADCTTPNCTTPEPTVSKHTLRPQRQARRALAPIVRAVRADDPMKAFACSTSPSCASRR
jgi:hypothetical protein